MSEVDPFADDPTWQEFRTTRIVINASGSRLEVAPAGLESVDGFLPGVIGPLHVLTAWNPQGVASDESSNRAAGEQLAAELATIPGVRSWPTTGFGVDDSWREEGFTVEGLTRPAAILLAVHYDQRAIFEWSNQPGGFRLIACDGSANEPRGWTLRMDPVPTP